jgi:hypothetical protein
MTPLILGEFAYLGSEDYEGHRRSIILISPGIKIKGKNRPATG